MNAQHDRSRVSRAREATHPKLLMTSVLAPAGGGGTYGGGVVSFQLRMHLIRKDPRSR